MLTPRWAIRSRSRQRRMEPSPVGATLPRVKRRFNRFAVTRELNDGLLASRFAPSQPAWVLSGFRVPVDPTVSASAGCDAGDR